MPGDILHVCAYQGRRVLNGAQSWVVRRQIMTARVQTLFEEVLPLPRQGPGQSEMRCNFPSQMLLCVATDR
jgi:hypothetical protein